jgi:hypothetical protein
MEVSLKLVHKLGNFESDVNETNEEGYKELVEFIEQVTQGKVSFISFQKKGIEYYFPEDIVKQSIISIIKH